MNNLEVKNLNKSFKEFSLKNVNIKVPAGKIVGLIGENGAGKTTIIKCVLDAMAKDSGEVKLFGKDYNYKLKDDVGIVYDDSFINESFTIKDLNLIMKNTYSKWDQRLFYKYIKEFNIPYKKEIKKLSTGMRKKVEIAACISHHPRLLILDEPTSGLDPVIRSEILDMFQEFVEDKNNAILLSTHITSDLEHIADDVIFISKGTIVFDEPLKNVKEDYIVIELTKDEFKKFNKKDITRYKENRNDYQVLIEKKNMKKEYNKYIRNITTLDDIMLLYIRGAICED
jgi:ABC-2 type transport system ATP-binding protein